MTLTVDDCIEQLEEAKREHWLKLMEVSVSQPSRNIVVEHGTYCKRMDIIRARLETANSVIELKYYLVLFDMYEMSAAFDTGDTGEVARILVRSIGRDRS